MTGEIRKYMDPNKMAERKKTAHARLEGYAAGRCIGESDGFRRGLAWGIFCTALFFITVYAIGRVIG